ESEPRFDGQRVTLVPEVAEAVRAFADAGFIAATHDYARGGMQLPFSVALACYGIFRGANAATDTYGSLTSGAAELIHEFGSEAPRGVKGISLFIAPKSRVNDDGTLGARNDVSLAGLIHKMGFRGSTSTILNFGERGECVAELLGEPGEGLACMFRMMNGARI